MTFLPYGCQSVTEDDIAAVVATLRSDFLTSGPMVERFEAALCATCGATAAISVTSNTAGLHMALMSQNLGPEDVVIVPSITFLATANAVAYCGAQVVFADVDPLSGLMTPETFEDALLVVQKQHPHLRFAGVIPVHLAGRMVDLTPIYARAKALGAFVIDDAAHAIGSCDARFTVGDGQFSDMTVFSFHPVKTITTGEGGAIMCNDAVLAQRLRLLRSHGMVRDPSQFTTFAPEPWIYEQQILGFNYRLPDINCALGLSQLQRLGVIKAHRQNMAKLYRRAIDGMTHIHWRAPPEGADYCLHLMSILIDFDACGVKRAGLMDDLRTKGIGTQVHYIPVHKQPYWQAHQVAARALSGAETYYAQTLSLPLHMRMQEADAVRVMDALFEGLRL
jgi:UDP-4-amino-4,6-dideoxy-N-acetyl-beta-L-altrosamine transaminase